MFLDGSMCMLGRALAMEWMSRVIFLEAAICDTAATFRRMWGGAIPASAYKLGIGVIILHLSFRAVYQHD